MKTLHYAHYKYVGWDPRLKKHEFVGVEGDEIVLVHECRFFDKQRGLVSCLGSGQQVLKRLKDASKSSPSAS